jgi:hypothetical protein
MANRSTSPAPLNRRQRSKPFLRRAAFGLTGLAVAGATAATMAAAAPPAFPDNIVVFPDRDFVTIEGYQNHLNEKATVEVFRGEQIVGSAEGIVGEGDVAFEINHPGGYCWGDGTGLKVTPDIRPGDRVALRFGSEKAGDTIVQDTAVDTDTILNGNTVIVKGNIAADVDRNRLEQRIVNPDLTDLVGRRDVRALPGALTPSEKGGYSSGLVVEGNRFTATYEFDAADAASTAATGGGERMMAWQVEDVDGNRQGLTIAEYGELGGPGMGGCPAGPADTAAPAPGTAAVTRSNDNTQLRVVWTPAVPAPGAAAVTGYSVEAIAQTEANGQHDQIGRRTGPDATATTISNVKAGEFYTVEVRSLAGNKMSESFSVKAPPSDPAGDLEPPVVTATPAPEADGAVTVTSLLKLSAEAGADIYYTTGNDPVLANGDLPADNAKLYTGDIAITSETTVNWVAFDQAGNVSRQVSGTFAPPAPNVELPGAPTLGNSTPGEQSLTLRWTSNDPTVTGYGVQLYDGTTDTKVGDLRKTADTSLTITDLDPAKSYTFTVQAENSAGPGAASERSALLTPQKAVDRITIATARWKVGDFRVSGSGSKVGATVTIHSGSATGPELGTGQVTQAVAPATGGVYDLRFRDRLAPAQKPNTIYVTSSGEGVAGPFTVANG